ncbi:Hypothetical protein NCDO2118_p0042 (plasmid) [Lactococcus lactis subsp. lactis NCDO 2118]|uniref:Uncharacterized protein n=1 Tax=Lactococcus lactis subsp. lactis NCDO 2118 TaxID=1117941 RepID=A0ABC8A9H5_LACLL|nr:Hypothetical protein NCDO2118_p0042 [Lactococcus lactis subsp. lactis NCDO 2118]
MLLCFGLFYSLVFYILYCHQSKFYYLPLKNWLVFFSICLKKLSFECNNQSYKSFNFSQLFINYSNFLNFFIQKKI